MIRILTSMVCAALLSALVLTGCDSGASKVSKAGSAVAPPPGGPSAAGGAVGKGGAAFPPE